MSKERRAKSFGNSFREEGRTDRNESYLRREIRRRIRIDTAQSLNSKCHAVSGPQERLLI
jgi:hypothetical protein